jgi:protein TonB
VSPEPATETAVPVASTAPPTNSAATGTPSSAPAPVTSAPVAATEPAPRIELPSASAAYLNNPPPAYPALSRRLGEQGRVVLRVRIEPDGTASAAEIRTSSGYERLDEAARQAVLSWRYVPGKRNGVPEAMWFLIPIQFELR